MRLSCAVLLAVLCAPLAGFAEQGVGRAERLRLSGLLAVDARVAGFLHAPGGMLPLGG